jgi:thymidine kinase
MPRSNNGSITVILGPMFSGKTSELMRRMRRQTVANKKCLAIKYYHDNRYDRLALDVSNFAKKQIDEVQENMLSSHDLIKVTAILSKGNNLEETINSIENLEDYDCLFIDEIQFYNDGASTADFLANQGFEVTVCGLQSDYLRKPYGCIPQILAYAETIVHLTAIDSITGQEASFTARISNEKEQEVQGGSDKYIAVDRQHYMKNFNYLN